MLNRLTILLFIFCSLESEEIRFEFTVYPKEFSQAGFTPEYLQKAKLNFEVCFLIIAAEIWKLAPKDRKKNRASALWHHGYKYLQNED